jgi:PHP family Zn ribbon phosphoesterase
MLKEYSADLHVHTCLSPCADETMVPSALVRQALQRHLDAIGICDHNSTANVVAVRKAGQKAGLRVLGGIEVTSREEVHILGFFDDEDAREDMQTTVDKSLSGENDEAFFGRQLIVDECDNIVGTNGRLLIGSTSLSVEDIVGHIHRLGGIAVASHVDRESFGLIGQLGFVPQQLGLDALEISPHVQGDKLAEYKKHGLPLMTSSDAHFLDDLGRSRTRFIVEELSCSEIAQACAGTGGRRVMI